MRKEREEWRKEWVGMPEFVQEQRMPFGEVIVRFKTEKDKDDFFALIQQTPPSKLKSIWFPKSERKEKLRQEYVDES